MNLLIAILTSYVVTKTITAGHIFLPARKLFRRIMWRTRFREMFTATSHISDEIVSQPDALVEEDGEPMDDELDEFRTGFDFISCALCVGFYVSLVVSWLLCIPAEGWIEQWLAVWGGSYFLATQERP